MVRVDEELPTEVNLELQLDRLSRCWTGEGNTEVGKGASGRGGNLHQSRSARESGNF